MFILEAHWVENKVQIVSLLCDPQSPDVEFPFLSQAPGLFNSPYATQCAQIAFGALGHSAGILVSWEVGSGASRSLYS